LTFTSYYNQPDGTGNVKAARDNFKGTFVNFANQDGDETPELLEVTKDSGETIYVQLNDLLEA